MKRPSFQFYADNWLGNKNLRRCTFAERGIWIDAMCLLHDSEEYGVLRWPLEELANAIGCRVADLQSLRRKQVLKGVDTGDTFPGFQMRPRHAGREGAPIELLIKQPGPLWFSSRMVWDEYKRKASGGSGRFSPDDSPSHGHGDDLGLVHGVGASSLSPSSTASLRSAVGRGTRLPADWTPSPILRAWALADQPTWDDAYADRVAADFRDYWIAVPGNRGVKLDWDATWRKWIRKEGPRSLGPGGRGAVDAWWTSDAGIQRKGEELGMQPRPGETMASYRDRIKQRIEDARKTS